MKARIVSGGTLMPARDAGTKTLVIERDPRVILSSVLVRGAGRLILQLHEGPCHYSSHLQSRSFYSGCRLSECGKYKVARGEPNIRAVHVTEADETTELLLVELGGHSGGE